MLACTTCKIEMKCIKNGVACDYGIGHTYPGDLFQCPVCKHSTISTNYNSSYDPDYKYCDHYLKMKSDLHYGIPQIDIDAYLKKHFTKP